MQHIKLLPTFYIDTREHIGILYEFGVDYCTEDDDWIDGWKVRMNVTYISSINENFIRLNCSWYYGNTIIKNETMYCFQNRFSDYNASFRLWVDLWFNRINASSTVGGRINAYYFPMTDSSQWWYRWITGENWGVDADKIKQSMYFTDLRDAEGNIIHAPQVKMVRVTFRIQAPLWDTWNNTIRACEYDVFDLTFGRDPLEGIQTPVFDETKTPVMPQGGFLGFLWAAIGNLITKIQEIFGPAALGFWSVFVGFLDTVFSAFGWPNGFSTILSWIDSLKNWIVNSFTYLISFLTSAFTFIMAISTKSLNTLSTVITQIVNVIQRFFDFFSTTMVGAQNIWDALSLGTWITIGAILYPMFLLFLWEQKGLDAVLNHIKMVLDILWWFVSIFITVIQLFLNLIGRIIESIPVVE